MKLTRAILKFQCPISRAQLVLRGYVPETKMFPRLISNSGKRKIRKKSIRKILELFEDFGEVFFLDFVRTKWAELAVSNHNQNQVVLSKCANLSPHALSSRERKSRPLCFLFAFF